MWSEGHPNDSLVFLAGPVSRPAGGHEGRLAIGRSRSDSQFLAGATVGVLQSTVTWDFELRTCRVKPSPRLAACWARGRVQGGVLPRRIVRPRSYRAVNPGNGAGQSNPHESFTADL